MDVTRVQAGLFVLRVAQGILKTHNASARAHMHMHAHTLSLARSLLTPSFTYPLERSHNHPHVIIVPFIYVSDICTMEDALQAVLQALTPSTSCKSMYCLSYAMRVSFIIII